MPTDCLAPGDRFEAVSLLKRRGASPRQPRLGAGDLPVSMAKYWGLFAAITAAAGTLLTLLGVGSWLASCFV